MIPQNRPHWQTQDWQDLMRQLIKCPADLAQRLALSPNALDAAICEDFPLRLPVSLLNRIKPGDINDPVLKQFLPVSAEREDVPGFVVDPLQEQDKNPTPGLLQKFDNRVLLTLTQSCAVHCRFCFRRTFNYADNTPSKLGWQAVYKTIRENVNIEEVILSGGDPLSLPDDYLNWHLQKIAEIPHIKVTRFHTRFPVMIPQRVTENLLQILKQHPLPIVWVLHINHANEINDEVKHICALLKSAGVQLLNQTVILRGVNDDVTSLRDLSWALFDCGIQPYYLHCFDPVKGAHHFDVPVSDAKQLYLTLREKLPGYLVPQLVKEVPGEKAKVVI